MKDFDHLYHLLIAGLSGGFIRIRVMMMKGERLNFLKIIMELLTAAISAFYVGDFVISWIPTEYNWSDNFVHFITGYGGMGVVDWVYKKFIKND